ncbi:MAG: protease pro-enzyme activation domain-containing protein [Caulobacterales bacterium]
MLPFAGALVVGVLIGWFTYYINRYRTSGLQLGDITTLLGVVGTGALALFKDRTIFAGYCFGLGIGFFGYLIFLVSLVLRSPNFTLDWFLDGRRKEPVAPFYIPDGTAVTVRPAFAPPIMPRAISGPAAASNQVQKAPNSFRSAPRHPRVGEADPTRTVHLTVVLKPELPIVPARYAGGRGLGREEFRSLHAARDTTVSRVAQFASQYGLTVEKADAGQHIVKLVGTLAQATAAFQPEQLGMYRGPKGDFMARAGHLVVPTDIAGEVVAVMGFDERPVARPHSRFRPAGVGGDAISYTPTQVAQRYNFPADATGAGQTVALIELGGGFDPADVAAYFNSQGIARAGTLEAVPVDGATTTPDFVTNGPDGEVQLDIDIVGCIAPGANIAVYFGPNQGSGFYDTIHAAINDDQRSPKVISISWGSPESDWAAQDMDAMDQLFQTATGQNITVCVASGDHGAVDGSADGNYTTDFPASSPNVMGCGGTSLTQDSETAWNDGDGWASGGGFSGHFARPSYQTQTISPWRGVPDVSGNADSATGYIVRVDGQSSVSGGTSAVAPLWAALIALANEKLDRPVGFVNAKLYVNQGAFVDIVDGGNDGYEAANGWDPVTGLGRPIGSSLIGVL